MMTNAKSKSPIKDKSNINSYSSPTSPIKPKRFDNSRIDINNRDNSHNIIVGIKNSLNPNDSSNNKYLTGIMKDIHIQKDSAQNIINDILNRKIKSLVGAKNSHSILSGCDDNTDELVVGGPPRMISQFMSGESFLCKKKKGVDMNTGYLLRKTMNIKKKREEDPSTVRRKMPSTVLSYCNGKITLSNR